MTDTKAQEKYLSRLYEKQMKRPCLLPKDIGQKIKLYKKLGKFEGRLIFKAGIPALIQPSRHKPFGWLALYDDMTKDDIAGLFGMYKDERKRYLANQGIRKRKYITSSAYRDFDYLKIAKRFNWDYKKAAAHVRYKYGAQVRVMLLEYIWEEPTRIHSPQLRELVEKAKSDKLNFDQFVADYSAKLTKSSLETDLDNYIKECLPVNMCSAVARLKKDI